MDEQVWKEVIRRRELGRQALHVSDLAAHIGVSEDFITPTPKILAKLIESISDLLFESIGAAPEIDLPTVNFFLGQIASHLRYVDRARVAQTPWSLVQPADVFLNRHIEKGTHFIIRPQWSYNYSLMGDFWDYYGRALANWSWFPLAKLNDAMTEIGFGLNDRIFCISFPRVERNNVLMHCLWGHEFGHILAGKWMDQEFGDYWAKAEPAIRDRIHIDVKSKAGPVDPLFENYVFDEMTSSQLANTMKIARDGLTEIICDYIGVHLFGPTAVAASIEFAARFELDTSPLDGGNYPPWRYRLRLQLEHCNSDFLEDEAIDYPGPALRLFIDWLLEAKVIVSDKKEKRIIDANIVTREAYQFIETSWPEVSKAMVDLLPESSKNPYRLRDRFARLEKLVQRLEDGIPPNEVRNLAMEPSSLEDVLTSGWIRKISGIHKQGSDGTIFDVDSLELLVLKGCESSFVQAEWGPGLNGVHK